MRSRKVFDMAKKKPIFNMEVNYGIGEAPSVAGDAVDGAPVSKVFFTSLADKAPEIGEWVLAVISYTSRKIPIIDIRMVRFNGKYWDTKAGGNAIPTERILGWTNPTCFTM
jgi:hypothetical protein